MDKNELKLLAQKYLDGTATAEEKQKLNQWYDAANTGWPETVQLRTAETGDDVKQRLFNSLHKQLFRENKPAGKTSGALVKRLSVWIGSAAAVLALMFFAWMWYGKGATKPIVTERRLVNVPTNRVMHLTLADGSRVWLNAGSVFRYPKNFTGKTRMVELVEGRAFFDIRHESNHPFIVRAKALNITVLGTSFDVSSYKKDGVTRVSVVTGKVGITSSKAKQGKAVFLLPKQQLVACNDKDWMQTEPVMEAAVNAWCKNNFVFEQESLSDVFKALEKEYHTKITVDNKKLLDERISIKLNNQHLDTIMEILSFTKHFKYQMANDSTVVVK